MTLPHGWAVTSLEDICAPVLKVLPSADPDSSFRYIDISSIDNRRHAIVSPQTLFGRDAPSRARQSVRAGDVLFSTVRTSLENIALVPSELDGSVASTGFCVLRPADGIAPKFIFYGVLRLEFLNGLAPQQRGTSYPAVRDTDVKAMPFPLAPTAEQPRIVAAIEEQFSRIDAGVEALRHVHLNLQRTRAAVLSAACEGRLPTDGLRPEMWRRGTIYDLVGPTGVFVDGDWVETKDQDPNGDVRLIQLADIGDGTFRNRSRRFLTSAKAAELRCTYLEPGDVLVARMPDPLGRSAIFPGDPRPCVTAVDVCIIRPEPDRAVPRWIMWAVNAPQFRKQVSQLEKGTTRKRISRKNLGTILMPIPSLAEQHRIVSSIESWMSLVDAVELAVESSERRAERLRAAILTEAFSGRLVGQDPSDEPSSIQLDRVRAAKAAEGTRPHRPRRGHADE